MCQVFVLNGFLSAFIVGEYFVSDLPDKKVETVDEASDEIYIEYLLKS